MELARAILMVFHQNEAGTEGQGDVQEDSGLSSWNHVVSGDVFEYLRSSPKEGTVWALACC